MQLVARRDRIPNEAAQLVREVFFESYQQIIDRVHEETKNIPDRWWIEIPDDDKREYEVMMREVRLQLRERGYYSADMLTLQRRIRCKLDSSRAECADPQEYGPRPLSGAARPRAAGPGCRTGRHAGH